MKVLLTGATGYIAQRLLPVLLEQGYDVLCLVRDASRFTVEQFSNSKRITVIEADLLVKESLNGIPLDIDAAYYLVHSMSSNGEFSILEEKSAQNFSHAISLTKAKQIIYLSGIVNEKKLSKHLSSRKNVETILSSGPVPLTCLRAGIIVGSGSASFEIIRDLVEKLPVMITPKWLQTKCQPISIRNVIEFLSGVLFKKETYSKHYDIYGPQILTYKEMLLDFAAERGLKRLIIILPVMTPRLSSYWLYFVTSTSYSLAKNLVDSMKIDVVAVPNDLQHQLSIKLMSYNEAIKAAFDKIEQNLVLSSWKDAVGTPLLSKNISKHMEIPQFGVFTDRKILKSKNPEKSTERIFAIGGDSGWYYGNWLWNFRGFIDKLFGGVGLKRGRKNKITVATGDSLDFWRVLYANPKQKRLLLYAEMKLPGEAWLEFKMEGDIIIQTAVFRPLGLAGRLYWYSVIPFHYFIFNGMIKKIAN